MASPLTPTWRKPVPDIVRFLLALHVTGRIERARAEGFDPEALATKLHTTPAMITASELLPGLRRMFPEQYRTMQTTKAIGDALGAHVGGLNLQQVRDGGLRYFVVPEREQLEAMLSAMEGATR